MERHPKCQQIQDNLAHFTRVRHEAYREMINLPPRIREQEQEIAEVTSNLRLLEIASQQNCPYQKASSGAHQL